MFLSLGNLFASPWNSHFNSFLPGFTCQTWRN